MLVLPCLVFAYSVLALPLSEHERDILSLLAGHADSFYPSPHTTHSFLTTVRPFSTLSANPSQTSPPTSQSTPEQWMPTPTSLSDSAQPTAVKTQSVSTPTILPASAESHTTDHSDKTWQIIGIVIIAVLFVATFVTCAMFFDRLCSFLKDVVCCTSRPRASEEFIPDDEKYSWDTGSLSPSSYLNSLREEASLYTIRTRELPWNSDSRHWNTLHRQPSRRNDRPLPE